MLAASLAPGGNGGLDRIGMNNPLITLWKLQLTIPWLHLDLQGFIQRHVPHQAEILGPRFSFPLGHGDSQDALSGVGLARSDDGATAVLGGRNYGAVVLPAETDVCWEESSDVAEERVGISLPWSFLWVRAGDSG